MDPALVADLHETEFVGHTTEATSAEVLGWLDSGRLSVEIGATYPLERAADAHRDLEARRTTGKVLLAP